MTGVLVVAGTACETEESGDAVVRDEVPAASQEPAPDDSPALPDPQGKFESRCDYLLGDFTESASGYRFVADATLRNTGNVGIVARATAIWDQLGGDPVKATKTVRVGVGKSRRAAFTVVATQDQIDRHQSADSECRVRVNITDTFGSPQ